MEPLDYIVLIGFILIILWSVFVTWSTYEATRFTHLEGEMRRGLMIWKEPLSRESRQFLGTLPSLRQYGKGFIRKEGHRILISEERSFWKNFLSWDRALPYVAYVDLAMPERKIEFRISFPTLIYTIVSLFMIVSIPMIILPFFMPLKVLLSPDMPILGMIFVYPIMILFINHNGERARLLSILKQAISTRSEGNER